MRRIDLRGVFLVLGLVAMTGCGDPLSGKWENKDDDDIDLDIEQTDDGWEGDGHIGVCFEGGDCFLCPIDFEVTESGDHYEVEGEFTGSCSELGDFDDIECELNDAGDELECDLPNGGGTLEYEKKE
ncbi:MAG: hypothetical protein HOV80_25040 [Polyangiaceae bacterium]|nr:hypothetical protein [Polyangiaceae bacterium]